MTNDLKDAIEKSHQVVDHALRDIQSSNDRNAEGITQRVSFYDKLIILNGGTLAISFSAATSFHSLTQVKHLSAVNDLLSAWKLLIISIVLSLLSNWLSLNFILNMSQLLHGVLQQVSISRLNNAALPLDPTLKFEPLDASAEASRVRGKKERSYMASLQVGAFFGLVSQGATFLAYISLYLFARANLVA
jgi:hypothetical protein